MRTLCPGGWSTYYTHPQPVVLKEGDTEGPVSHGMCERCALMVEAELDKGRNELALQQYGAYLASPIDPRD